MDLMDLVRQRRPFMPIGNDGPQINQAALAPQPPQVQGPDPSDGGESRLASVYRDLANAEGGPASKAYRDFLSQGAPTSDQYKPGAGQRIAAILSGIGETIHHGPAQGMGLEKSMLDDPYNEAQQQYKIRGDRLAKSADLEEKDINNRVKTYRDINEFDIAGQKAAISKTRADAYAFSKSHPDWKPQALPGGNLIYVNPQDPTQQYDTGYASGKMTEEDKINLTNEGKFTNTQLQNSGRLANTVQAGKNSFSNITLQNSGRLANTALAGQNRLNQIDLSGENASALEDQRQIGRVDLKGIVPPDKTVVATPTRDAKGNVTSVTTKTNSTPAKPVVKAKPVSGITNTPKPKTADDAKAYLIANKKPVTDANIKHLLDNPTGW